MYNDMYIHLQNHIFCTLFINTSLSPPKSDHHWFSLCPQSFAFPRISSSWNCLVPMTLSSFTQQYVSKVTAYLFVIIARYYLSLNNTPLYRSVTIYSPIERHPEMFPCLGNRNKVTVSLAVSVFVCIFFQTI